MAAQGKKSPREGPGKGHATDISSQTVSDALRACLAKKDHRGAAMLLLAATTGLRAFQIASLTWGQVLDSKGEFKGSVDVPRQKAKGKHESHNLPLPPKTVTALKVLFDEAKAKGKNDPVFVSQRSRKALTAQAVVDWFRRLFRRVGVDASAHSARRYFITQAARAMSQARGSTEDLKKLAQHSNYQTTARYISVDPKAQGKMSQLVAQQIRI
jgi:integrase/recombinase XerD